MPDSKYQAGKPVNFHPCCSAFLNEHVGHEAVGQHSQIIPHEPLGKGLVCAGSEEIH